MTTPSPIKSRPISRRSLLQWGAASVGLGVGLGACAAQTTKVTPSGKTLKVLNIGVSSMPPTLDPSLSPGNASEAIVFNIFDTLIFANEAENFALQPGLASSWERVSDTTLDVTLNTNVKFHDGSKFTPDDVVFSLNRIIAGKIAGLSLSQSLLSTIQSVSAIGKNKIRVVAKAPDPILEERLSCKWGSWIIPEAYYNRVGQTTFETSPVGTGPYRVVSFSPNQLVLERFDGFWGPRPVADRIVWTLYVEDDARIAALFTGAIDIAGQIPPDQLTAVATRSGFTQRSVVLENMHLLTVNAQGAGLEDPNLRKALSLGIDRKLLVNALWGGHAQLDRGHQFPEYGKMYISDYPYYAYNVSEARSLVKGSSYHGEVLKYEYIPGDYVNAAPAAQAIVAMWQQIGVNAEVVATQNQTYAQIGTWSNSMRFPDPLGGLWLLWNPAAGDVWWKGNRQFTAVGTQMAVTMNDARRKVLAGELMKLWDTLIPGMPLYYPFYTWGMRDGLRWRPYPSLVMDFRAGNFSI